MSDRSLTRRECFGVLAAAAVFPRLPRVAAPASTLTAKPMRGAFMILSTPFTEAGEVDWDDLAHEVRFVDQAGAAWDRLAAGIEQRRQSHQGRANAWPGSPGEGEPGPQGRARPRRAGPEHRRDAGVRATGRGARARRADCDAAERRAVARRVSRVFPCAGPGDARAPCSCRPAAARRIWRRRSN